MRLALLAAALLPSTAFATISIVAPSATEYWVQGVSNLIQWTYSSGDPSSVDIIVNNANNQTLNGNFSIARNVPVSQESFTVTNVTLVVGTGYKVLFIDPATDTLVYAQSAQFQVETAGTSPAPTANPSSASSGTSTPSSGGNSTASGSSASSTSTSSKKSSSAAPGLVVDAYNLFYACGIIALGTFFL